MTKDEALKLALEALELISDRFDLESVAQDATKAITAIKEALAEQEQPEHCKYPECECPTETPCLRGLAQPDERNFCPRCGKRTADLTTIHTCTPPVAADPKAFHGFPSGSVSTPKAGGKCLTAGETAPTKEIDPNKWAFDNGLEST